MYDVDYKAILERWLGYPLNVTNGTLVSPDINIVDTIGTDGKKRWEKLNLKPPPRSDPSWPKEKCRNGWNYDTRDYDSTLVTEVNSTKAAFLIK